MTRYQKLNKVKRITGIDDIDFDPKNSFISDEPKVNVFQLDRKLGENDADYDPDRCRYKDQKGYSMKKYLKEKYGKELMELVEALI